MPRASEKELPPSTLQTMLDLGLIFAPAPVRKVASTRWGSKLVLIALAALLAKGILSIRWVDGKPQFSFDRQKAAEVKQELTQDLRQKSKEWAAQNGVQFPASGGTNSSPPWPGQGAGQPSGQTAQGYYYPPQQGQPYAGQPYGGQAAPAYPQQPAYSGYQQPAPAGYPGYNQPYQQPQPAYPQTGRPYNPPNQTYQQPGYGRY
jgi:hypothetical protein